MSKTTTPNTVNPFVVANPAPEKKSETVEKVKVRQRIVAAVKKHKTPLIAGAAMVFLVGGAAAAGRASAITTDSTPLELENDVVEGEVVEAVVTDTETA